MANINNDLAEIRKYFWGEAEEGKLGEPSQFTQDMLDASDAKARANAVSKLRSAGFSDAFVDTLDTKTATKYASFVEREADADTLLEKEELAKSYGHTDIEGKAAYYQSLIDNDEDIEKARTYEQWLDTKIASGGENIESARRFLQKINGKKNGLSDVTGGTGLYKSLMYYYDLIGSKAFTDLIKEEVDSGTIDNVEVSGLNKNGGYAKETDHIVVNLNGTDYDIDFAHKSGQGVDDTIKSELNYLVGDQPENGSIAAYEGETYIYVGGTQKNWYLL
jgi:hypothetical protein